MEVDFLHIKAVLDGMRRDNPDKVPYYNVESSYYNCHYLVNVRMPSYLKALEDSNGVIIRKIKNAGDSYADYQVTFLLRD